MKDKHPLENLQNVLFVDLLQIYKKYFGKPRIQGSHYISRRPGKVIRE